MNNLIKNDKKLNNCNNFPNLIHIENENDNTKMIKSFQKK